MADPGDLNKLYYGDNLDVLRQNIGTASVDLVYLDPPFNSNRSYSLLFKEKTGESSQAQLEAFDDTWTWSQESEALYDELLRDPKTPNAAKDALEAFRRLLGDNDVLAYLVMMTARLIELHRVLKPTGSLYLHCDPTASHYLKIALDAIFGPSQFRDEVIWQRHNARSVRQAIWPRLHDVILYYAKGERALFHPTVKASGRKAEPHDLVTGPDGQRYRTKDLTGPGTRNGETGKPWRGMNPTDTGRHWRTTHAALAALDDAGRLYWQKSGMPRELAETPYAPEERTVTVGDVWTDIDSINAGAAERLGYPTQKPLALLERIITASSDPGDVVLDPFCGCGTTVDAAQKLGRRWIGIDVTTLSIDLIDARLRATYGEGIRDTYETLGIPKDLLGAAALFKRSPFEFERWCVMLVEGQPNEKQVGDRGIDGVIRFPLGGSRGDSGRTLVSVKGGATNPGHVRDLVGTVKSQRAELGIFVTMNPATRGMVEAANQSGSWNHPANGQRYPLVQILTVEELLNGKRPNMPPALIPYFQAEKRRAEDHTEPLF